MRAFREMEWCDFIVGQLFEILFNCILYLNIIFHPVDTPNTRIWQSLRTRNDLTFWWETNWEDLWTNFEWVSWLYCLLETPEIRTVPSASDEPEAICKLSGKKQTELTQHLCAIADPKGSFVLVVWCWMLTYWSSTSFSNYIYRNGCCY